MGCGLVSIVGGVRLQVGFFLHWNKVCLFDGLPWPISVTFGGRLYPPWWNFNVTLRCLLHGDSYSFFELKTTRKFGTGGGVCVLCVCSLLIYVEALKLYSLIDESITYSKPKHLSGFDLTRPTSILMYLLNICCCITKGNTQVKLIKKNLLQLKPIVVDHVGMDTIRNYACFLMIKLSQSYYV